jgi:oligopeptide/dipeptide ABC transporter ATP-binding protein
MTAPLLEVSGLRKEYALRGGALTRRRGRAVRAVDDVSFSVARGTTLGLVGESGCGKTTTARAIMGLAAPDAGAVRLDGRDVLPLLAGSDRAAMLSVRRRLQYVFQDPYLALNPRWTVAETLAEPLRIHAPETRAVHAERVDALLAMVGLEPRQRLRYPHEFSGGQRQRVGIARALAVGPDMLLLDEPVSSLDVSVRAQVLNLLAGLQDRLGVAYLYISHDLGSVRFIASHVAVMYLGRVVEIGSADDVFERPRHHYTRALIDAVPQPRPGARAARPRPPGEVPSAFDRPSGCAYHPRCPAALPICREQPPTLAPADASHRAACHNPA